MPNFAEFSNLKIENMSNLKDFFENLTVQCLNDGQKAKYYNVIKDSHFSKENQIAK